MFGMHECAALFESRARSIVQIGKVVDDNIKSD